MWLSLSKVMKRGINIAALLATMFLFSGTSLGQDYYDYYDYYNWGYDPAGYDDDWFYDWYDYNYSPGFYYGDGYYDYGYDWDSDLFDWEEDGLFD